MSRNKLIKDEREFVNGVWRKVKYLEYLKSEEEITSCAEKKILKKTLKIALFTSAAAAAFILPAFFINGFDMFFIMYSGIVVLSIGVIYESFIESLLTERSHHEN